MKDKKKPTKPKTTNVLDDEKKQIIKEITDDLALFNLQELRDIQKMLTVYDFYKHIDQTARDLLASSEQ